MTETDRYLDSALVIRNLQKAERAHNLDAQGYLEKLAKAVLHCERAGNNHQRQADEYLLAKIAYFTEAHRRTVLTPQEAGLRAAAKHWGYTDPVCKIGFDPWCVQSGLDPAHARTLVRAGRSADALNAFRRERRVKEEKHKNVKQRERSVVSAKSVAQDPLRRFKIEWLRLSPENCQNAIDWIMENDTSTWQEAAE